MKIPTILGTAVLGAFVTTAPLAAQPPVPEPAALTADEVQRNALAAIADRFAVVAKDVDALPD